MSDGLTVPFALAAGLSGAAVSTRIVVTAGMAEIAAGAIAMGLGGYLAARSDAEHYANERRREEAETIAVPETEAREITEIFEAYGIKPDESAPVVAALRRNQKAWVDFMMQFELGLSEPHPARARNSAFTIGGAYIAGGLIPLLPYMLLPNIGMALRFSAIVTMLALLCSAMSRAASPARGPSAAPSKPSLSAASPPPPPSSSRERCRNEDVTKKIGGPCARIGGSAD